MNNDQRAMSCRRAMACPLMIAALAYSAMAKADNLGCDPELLLSRARAQFAQCDRNGDSKLTLDEFLSAYPAAEHADGRRQFVEFDRGGDGKLSRGEFGKLVMPTDGRGEVRDPMVEIEQGAEAKMKAVFAAADRDSDRALRHNDWPAEQHAPTPAPLPKGQGGNEP
jgi:hypothetical protein